MKILHTADWHLGKRLLNHSRLEEQKVVMQEIIDIADEQQVDAVLIAGDLFDVPLPSNEANQLFQQTLKTLSKNATRPVIAIAGNHDSAQYISNFSHWGGELGIFLLGFPDDKVSCIKLDSGVEVRKSSEGFVEIKMPQLNVPLRILLTPYANELRLKTYFSLENQEQELREFLQNHWQSQADSFLDEEGINILMTHLFVMKKDGEMPKESEGEKSILVGSAQPIYTNNFPKNLHYVALGHLHRCHTVSEQYYPIVYSGSPLAYSFSEAYRDKAQEKFVVIADLKPDKKAKLEKIKLHSGKKLIRKTFADVQVAKEWLIENPDCLVELTIESEKFLSAQDTQLLYRSHEGIVGTIIPKVKSNKRKETEVFSHQKSLKEQFVAYFEKENAQVPSQDILELFEQIRTSNS